MYKLDVKLLSVLFILPLLVLAAWSIYLMYQRDTGQTVVVAIEGYDPRDLLSGRYIQYTINWEKTDCQQFADGVCPQDEFCVNARWGRQCRFYIPEENASELDRLFQLRDKNDLNFTVVYSYKPYKHAIAKNLLINGADWHQYLTSSKADKN